MRIVNCGGVYDKKNNLFENIFPDIKISHNPGATGNVDYGSYLRD